MYFADRQDAGRRLAGILEPLRAADRAADRGGDAQRDARDDVVVLGLPRGGVPVAAEVAKDLDAPLDVIMVRKLGVPFQPELGMGAIGEDGVQVLNHEVLHATGVTGDELAEVQAAQSAELERRAARYRKGRDRIDLRGRTALVIDDGVATGSTAKAACQVARAHGAARVVLAVPVAPEGWTIALADAADELLCLATPAGFMAVGQWYQDFEQTTDEEVVACLDAAARRTRGRHHPDPEVRIQAGSVTLEGALTVPPDAAGLVVFAHGSGSSRHSPRNKVVADALHDAGLATLLFDLLTAEEEGDRANVFDTELLAGRLTEATHWLRRRPEVARSAVGYFGASTGAAAALWAAAEPDSPVTAVVSRGGRPDLAAPRLPQVTAPTLLIVGGADEAVLLLNRRAQALLSGPSRLDVVPGATHLFSEPGALEEVARLAAEWFTEHLAAVRHS